VQGPPRSVSAVIRRQPCFFVNALASAFRHRWANPLTASPFSGPKRPLGRPPPSNPAASGKSPLPFQRPGVRFSRLGRVTVPRVVPTPTKPTEFPHRGHLQRANYAADDLDLTRWPLLLWDTQQGRAATPGNGTANRSPRHRDLPASGAERLTNTAKSTLVSQIQLLFASYPFWGDEKLPKVVSQLPKTGSQILLFGGRRKFFQKKCEIPCSDSPYQIGEQFRRLRIMRY